MLSRVWMRSLFVLTTDFLEHVHLKNIYCFLPKYSIVFISKPVLKVLYNILLSNIALNCWSILARSIHFLQTRLCVYFEFNKFSLTFLETISDCSDQTIIVAPV